MSNWKYQYTKAEVCRILGLDRRELDQLLEAGEIPPPMNVGGARLWHVCDIADQIRAHPERLRPDQRPPRQGSRARSEAA
jgi:hypothetical protein